MANPDGTQYTWQQTWWFFSVGIFWILVGTLPPVVVTLWDAYYHYSNPIDWTQIGRLAVACVGPAVIGYWQSHKNLLQLPPGLILPPEFQPKITTKVATTKTTEGTVTQVEQSVTQTVEQVAAPAVATDADIKP